MTIEITGKDWFAVVGVAIPMLTIVIVVARCLYCYGRNHGVHRTATHIYSRPMALNPRQIRIVRWQDFVEVIFADTVPPIAFTFTREDAIRMAEAIAEVGVDG